MKMFFVADNPVPILQSLIILLVLIVLLGASCWVFGVLLKMWTTHRPIAALRQWARPRGYALLGPDRASVPAILEGSDPLLRPVLELRTVRLTKTQPRAASFIQLENVSSAGEGSAEGGRRWHVMIMSMEANWSITGLRPSQAAHSILDLLRLRTSPSLVESQRFSVMGQEIAPARQLAGSGVRSLLPADIGLILGPGVLLLDFSNRPFDDIEFERMLVIANQALAALPTPTPATPT